MANMAIDTS